MHVGPMLTDFLERAVEAASENDIKDLVTEVAARLGLPRFALVSHVDLLRETSGVVAISNYPDGWIERILEQRYFLDDPLHAASTGTRIGFAWHDVPKMIAMTRRQAGILAEAAAFGLSDGVTVPVHAPGEYRGTCSMGGRDGVVMSAQLRAAVQLIAVFAFEAARRVTLERAGQPRPHVPALSPRHVDCVGLIASGFGDTQIAHMLSLSEDTVHQHIREAMRRYGVFKRTALVFRSLFDGQICFQKVGSTSPF